MSLLYNKIACTSDKQDESSITHLNPAFSINKSYIIQNIEERNFVSHCKQERLRQKLASTSSTSVLNPLYVYRNGQCFPYDQSVYAFSKANNSQLSQARNQKNSQSNQYSVLVYQNQGFMEVYQFLMQTIFAANQNYKQLMVSMHMLIKIISNTLNLFQSLIQSNILHKLEANLLIQQFLINPTTLEISLFDFNSFNKKNKFNENPTEISFNQIIGNLVYNLLTLTHLSKPNKNFSFNRNFYSMNVQSTIKRIPFYFDLFRQDEDKHDGINKSFIEEIISSLFLMCQNLFAEESPITMASLNGQLLLLQQMEQHFEEIYS